MSFRRLILVGLAGVTVTACTPAQLARWNELDGNEQREVVEYVVREAAHRHDVDPELLVRIVRCESGLRPDAKNPRSSALGLGQHLPAYWPARAEALGYDPAAWADPNVNADVTAWLVAAQGTTPYNSSRGCWARE